MSNLKKSLGKKFVLSMLFSISSLIIDSIAVPSIGGEFRQKLNDRSIAYKEPAIKFLGQLVSIDSATGDEVGVNRVSALVLKKLAPLKAKIEKSVATAPAKGDNIVASFVGTGKAKILIIAHMDTVFPKGSVSARPFTIKSGIATGPGVADDKSGIVTTVFALKALNDIGFKDYQRLTVLFNSNEETGSYGTRELIAKLSREHDVVLNTEAGTHLPGDPSGADEAVGITRKGRAVLSIDVAGKASHAGVAPEKGRNAASELAAQVLKLPSLESKDKATTVNLTVFHTGGDQTNVIPDKATALADVRANYSEEFDRVEKSANEVMQDHMIPDTHVSISMARDFPPLPKNNDTDKLAELATGIYAELGKKLTTYQSGGSSDNGFVYETRTPSIDGFGLVGKFPHSVDEYVVLDSVSPRIYLLARMVMELSAQK